MAFAQPLRRLFGFAKAREPFGASRIAVPAGTVNISSDNGKARRVKVRAFELDVRPVTNREWEAFITATAGVRPPWMYRPGWADPEQPVVGITYDEAQSYARWANKRLPREVEWQRAACGVDGPWPWGNSDPNLRHACFDQGAGGVPEICSQHHRAPGFGTFGHRDLYGNVWEWCEGSVLRGGFWGSATLSPQMRLTEAPTTRSAGIGLRLAV